MNALSFFPNDASAQQTSSIFQSQKVGQVEPERVCTQCGSTDTPLWRRGPHGPKSMCNRCGIRWKRKEDKKGKKPNSNKKKKESTPKAKKIRSSSDRDTFSSSSLSPTHDSDSWISEPDDEDEMEYALSSKTKVITMGSETSEPDNKESLLTVNLTQKGDSFTVDEGTFVRPEVPEPRRLSRDFININTSVNYTNDTEPHDGMNLRKRKAKARSNDFEYEWNTTSSSPARRKSRQELLQEVRELPNHVRVFLEEAEAELKKIQKQEQENSEIYKLNQLVQLMQSEIAELRQQNMQKDAMVSALQDQLQKTQQHAQAVALFPHGFRPFGGLYANSIPILPHEIQRVNLLPQSC